MTRTYTESADVRHSTEDADVYRPPEGSQQNPHEAPPVYSLREDAEQAAQMLESRRSGVSQAAVLGGAAAAIAIIVGLQQVLGAASHSQTAAHGQAGLPALQAVMKSCAAWLASLVPHISSAWQQALNLLSSAAGVLSAGWASLPAAADLAVWQQQALAIAGGLLTTACIAWAVRRHVNQSIAHARCGAPAIWCCKQQHCTTPVRAEGCTAWRMHACMNAAFVT
jgi:hypothetical protein